MPIILLSATKNEGNAINMKKIIALCILLALASIISACAGNTPDANNPDRSALAIEEIQYDPASHIGAITLIGIAGPSPRQNFALQNESGTFEVHVDYRGSQALPQIGDKISVEGQLTRNRPCCGPGFTLTSTRFEKAD